MSTRIPVTLEGNLTDDPKFGTSDNGTDYAQFTVAVNARRLNEQTQQWEDGDAAFHRVSVFRSQAQHVRDSLRRGDTVVVTGEMAFKNFTDREGNNRESREIVANTVAPSLRYTTVEIDRSPKVRGPEAEATGPVAQPEPAGASVER